MKLQFPARIMFALFALALTTCFCACNRTDQKPVGQPDKITIAFATLPETAIAQVAQMNGFFLQEGLEVTVHKCPYGKLALKEVLEGKADFATVAETPFMFAVMKGERISVIATILTSSLGHAIVARLDRGVRTLGDLKGKKIAATLGTTSDFFLESILVTHEISRKDVDIVDMKADKIPDALANGEIDAVSAFPPYSALAQKKLGDHAITFRDKDVYRYTFNVVATQEFIHNNPDKVKKMLGALVKSEDFVRENTVKAQKNVADFSGIETGMVRDIWTDASFVVKLDQALILALEDESQWAINGGLTNARSVPNYLDFIYLDGLKAVKPGAVRILR